MAAKRARKVEQPAVVFDDREAERMADYSSVRGKAPAPSSPSPRPAKR